MGSRSELRMATSIGTSTWLHAGGSPPVAVRQGAILARLVAFPSVTLPTFLLMVLLTRPFSPSPSGPVRSLGGFAVNMTAPPV